jgi:hypothetical protein
MIAQLMMEEEGGLYEGKTGRRRDVRMVLEERLEIAIRQVGELIAHPEQGDFDEWGRPLFARWYVDENVDQQNNDISQAVKVSRDCHLVEDGIRKNDGPIEEWGFWAPTHSGRGMVDILQREMFIRGICMEGKLYSVEGDGNCFFHSIAAEMFMRVDAFLGEEQREWARSATAVSRAQMFRWIAWSSACELFPEHCRQSQNAMVELAREMEGSPCWGTYIAALETLLDRENKESLTWRYNKEHVEGVTMAIFLALQLGISTSIVFCIDNANTSDSKDREFTGMDVHAVHVGLRRGKLEEWNRRATASRADRSEDAGAGALIKWLHKRDPLGEHQRVQLAGDMQHMFGMETDEHEWERLSAGEAIQCLRDVLYLKQETLGVPERAEMKDYQVFWGQDLLEATLWDAEGRVAPPVLTLVNYTVGFIGEEPVGHYQNVQDINVELAAMGVVADDQPWRRQMGRDLSQRIDEWRGGAEAKFARARAEDVAEARKRKGGDPSRKTKRTTKKAAR